MWLKGQLSKEEGRGFVKARSAAYESCFYPECQTGDAMQRAHTAVANVVSDCLKKEPTNDNTNDPTMQCTRECMGSMRKFTGTRCVFLSIEELDNGKKTDFWLVHDHYNMCLDPDRPVGTTIRLN